MNSLDLAIGTLVDDPSILPEPRPPLMKRMCGKCDLVLGWKVCAPDQRGEVTTGLCPECAAEVMAKIEAMPRTI